MNYNLITSFIFILLLLIILKIYNKIDMSMHLIIVMSIITVLLILKINSKEHMTPDEVIQNMGSVYNNQNMSTTNMIVTGKLVVGNPATNNVKMTVNDPTVNSGNTVDINNCNVITHDVNVSNILTSTNIANLRVSDVSDISNLTLSNVSELIATNDLDVTGLAQQISPTQAFPPKAFLKHRDDIKLVVAGTVNGPASRTWGQGWEIGFSGLGPAPLSDSWPDGPKDSYVRHFKVFNPRPGNPTPSDPPLPEHPGLSGAKFELTKV